MLALGLASLAASLAAVTLPKLDHRRALQVTVSTVADLISALARQLFVGRSGDGSNQGRPQAYMQVHQWGLDALLVD